MRTSGPISFTWLNAHCRTPTPPDTPPPWNVPANSLFRAHVDEWAPPEQDRDKMHFSTGGSHVGSSNDSSPSVLSGVRTLG